MSFWQAFVFIIFILVGLPVTAVFLLKLAKILKGEDASAGGDPDRLIREIHESLGSLEARIDSLETILMEHDTQEEEEKNG